jgi:hypothetical protein
LVGAGGNLSDVFSSFREEFVETGLFDGKWLESIKFVVKSDLGLRQEEGDKTDLWEHLSFLTARKCLEIAIDFVKEVIDFAGDDDLRRMKVF